MAENEEKREDAVGHFLDAALAAFAEGLRHLEAACEARKSFIAEEGAERDA